MCSHALGVICMVTISTYPDIVVILDKLRVSEQASLQHGLQQSQVDHVEEQQAQDGEIHDDGKLKEKGKVTDYKMIVHSPEGAFALLIFHRMTSKLNYSI